MYIIIVITIQIIQTLFLNNLTSHRHYDLSCSSQVRLSSVDGNCNQTERILAVRGTPHRAVGCVLCLQSNPATGGSGHSLPWPGWVCDRRGSAVCTTTGSPSPVSRWKRFLYLPCHLCKTKWHSLCMAKLCWKHNSRKEALDFGWLYCSFPSPIHPKIWNRFLGNLELQKWQDLWPQLPWHQCLKLRVYTVAWFESALPDCSYAITEVEYFSKWPEMAFCSKVDRAAVIQFLHLQLERKCTWAGVR